MIVSFLEKKNGGSIAAMHGIKFIMINPEIMFFPAGEYGIFYVNTTCQMMLVMAKIEEAPVDQPR